MPQSLSQIYLHTIFSTKNRFPFFTTPDRQSELHAYLAGTIKTLDCTPIQIGGVADHVHLLTTLSRTLTVADFVKETKRTSTI
jgi:putative transposase